MLFLAPWLLEHAPVVADDHRIRGDDELGVAFGAVELRAVDGETFRGRGLQDVFEGGEGLGEVFRVVGGDGFDVGKADLRVGALATILLMYV